MTASTLRQVEGFIQVKSVGAVQVKGVSQPVEAYRGHRCHVGADARPG